MIEHRINGIFLNGKQLKPSYTNRMLVNGQSRVPESKFERCFSTLFLGMRKLEQWYRPKWTRRGAMKYGKPFGMGKQLPHPPMLLLSLDSTKHVFLLLVQIAARSQLTMFDPKFNFFPWGWCIHQIVLGNLTTFCRRLVCTLLQFLHFSIEVCFFLVWIQNRRSQRNQILSSTLKMCSWRFTGINWIEDSNLPNQNLPSDRETPRWLGTCRVGD